MSSSESFNILFVCTANLCRSQLAEVRLRQHLPVGIDIRSAGTHAEEGRHIPSQFRPLFDRRDADTLTASRLTPAMLECANLVLTMTRSQRSDVVQILPRSVGYTFALAQFVEYAERALNENAALEAAASQGGGYRLLLDAVRSQRAMTRAGRRSVDIADSSRAHPRELRKITNEVNRYVDRLADAARARTVETEVVGARPMVAQIVDAI